MPAKKRERVIQQLHPAERERLLGWDLWARPNQLPPPGDWRIWLILAGRGWGKTRTGAEFIVNLATTQPKTSWHIVAPTHADVRGVCVEGSSGLLACLPPSRLKDYNRSLGEITLANGSIIRTFSADQPERLRGPQCHGAWCDELASWRYPMAWDMLMFGLRLGHDPKCAVTTTPKPTKLIRDLMEQPSCAVTRGSSYDNRENLADAFFEEIVKKYEGTRLGRQELNAEILEDVEGALWNQLLIDEARVSSFPDLARVVVAIDPAVTANAESDETGIVCVGLGVDGDCYVLADGSCKLSPDGWAKRSVNMLEEFHGDRIVAEVNNGGDMVERTVRTVSQHAPYRAVRASRGKATRAEPVAALYEQGRVHHAGIFPQLEDQMCSWDPASFDSSPDRVDALVWAITDLVIDAAPAPRVRWM